jgi:hypothetical protein
MRVGLSYGCASIRVQYRSEGNPLTVEEVPLLRGGEVRLRPSTPWYQSSFERVRNSDSAETSRSGMRSFANPSITLVL